MYFCTDCLSLLESLQHIKARHMVFTTQLQVIGTKYKVRVAMKICIVLVWGSQMRRYGNRSSSSHLSYKRGIFDCSRQRSFESWKKITESARERVFFHPSYLQNLFVLGLRPKSTPSALPHQKYRLMFHFLCLVYTNPLLHTQTCILGKTNDGPYRLCANCWDRWTETAIKYPATGDNRSFLVMSKNIYDLIEKMDWV